jgi:drug/metabolite transporter (DMT)-like permease
VIASALIFGETFSAARYVGMALILCGVAIVVLPLRTPAAWRRPRGQRRRNAVVTSM